MSTILRASIMSLLTEAAYLALRANYGLAELDRWWAQAKTDAVARHRASSPAVS